MIIKKFNLKIISLLIMLISFSACQNAQKSKSGDVQTNSNKIKAIKKIKLPKELREISALSFYKDSLLACVQDEQGVIFLIDYNQEKVVKKFRIEGAGDFEGIEIINDTAYLMKSNGKITRVANFTGKEPVIEKFDLGFSSKNDCEGLGYNTKTDELLIACKGKAALPDNLQKNEKLPELKKYRAVYVVNRKNMKPDIKPKYLLEKKEYEKISKTDDFKPSAIAIHPSTQNIYILASAGKLLIVIDTYGNYLEHKQLDPKIFVQPEGICFSSDGKKMFISNEGKGGKGNILIFE